MFPGKEFLWCATIAAAGVLAVGCSDTQARSVAVVGSTSVQPFAELLAEEYLAKNPAGYCGLGGTGVACPVGIGVTA